MKVFVVVAARPNFMKMKPVVDALEERGAEVSLVHTGQHYDPLMSDVFFDELGLRKPDHHLGVSGGTVVQTSVAPCIPRSLELDRAESGMPLEECIPLIVSRTSSSHCPVMQDLLARISLAIRHAFTTVT